MCVACDYVSVSKYSLRPQNLAKIAFISRRLLYKCKRVRAFWFYLYRFCFWPKAKQKKIKTTIQCANIMLCTMYRVKSHRVNLIYNHINKDMTIKIQLALKSILHRTRHNSIALPFMYGLGAFAQNVNKTN